MHWIHVALLFLAGVDVAVNEAMVNEVWDCLPASGGPKQSPAPEPMQPEESADLELPRQGSIFLSLLQLTYLSDKLI